MPFPSAQAGFRFPPPTTERRKKKQVLQPLFIDIQVGSIATGLEVAAVWGKWKVEGGVFVCSVS